VNLAWSNLLALASANDRELVLGNRTLICPSEEGAMFAFGTHLPFPGNLQFCGDAACTGAAANPALAKLFWTPYPRLRATSNYMVAGRTR
jgi:hypothetical protein